MKKSRRCGNARLKLEASTGLLLQTCSGCGFERTLTSNYTEGKTWQTPCFRHLVRATLCTESVEMAWSTLSLAGRDHISRLVEAASEQRVLSRPIAIARKPLQSQKPGQEKRKVHMEI